MDVLRCNRCNVKFESRDLLAMHMLDHSFSPEEDNATSEGNSDERSKLVTEECWFVRNVDQFLDLQAIYEHFRNTSLHLGEHTR